MICVQISLIIPRTGGCPALIKEHLLQSGPLSNPTAQRTAPAKQTANQETKKKDYLQSQWGRRNRRHLAVFLPILKVCTTQVHESKGQVHSGIPQWAGGWRRSTGIYTNRLCWISSPSPPSSQLAPSHSAVQILCNQLFQPSLPFLALPFSTQTLHHFPDFPIPPEMVALFRSTIPCSLYSCINPAHQNNTETQQSFALTPEPQQLLESFSRC